MKRKLLNRGGTTVANIIYNGNYINLYTRLIYCWISENEEYIFNQGQALVLAGGDQNRIVGDVLTTPGDLTTAVFDSKPASNYWWTAYSIFLADGDTKGFLSWGTNFYTFQFGTPLIASTVTNVDNVSLGYSFHSIFIKSDGSKMWGFNGTQVIYEYDFATNYDIQTLSLNKTITDTLLGAPIFSSDGKTLIVWTTSMYLREYSLATAFDINTRTFVYEVSLYGLFGAETAIGNPGLQVSSDGAKLYLSSKNTSGIEKEKDFLQLDLTAPFKLGPFIDNTI